MCEYIDSGIEVVAATAQKIGYEGFITIMLTGIAVMIAILAVVLALFAFWGYESIKKELIAASSAAAERVSLQSLEDKAIARATLVTERYLQELDPSIFLAAAQSSASKEASTESGPVAKPYPGEENRHEQQPNDAGSNNPPTPTGGPG